MAWFLGQSLVFLLLAFALGLVVGWLVWGRRSGVPAAPAALVAPAPRPAADADPVPIRARRAPVLDKPVFDGQAGAPEPQPFIAPVTPGEQDGQREDNLQRIEGIGPKISSVLNAAGIQTYDQLADTDRLTLTETLSAGGVKFAPSLATWSDQARLLANGDEAGFAEFTSQLAAGRRGR